jgi:K+-sensing histidine kinase KdpD
LDLPRARDARVMSSRSVLTPSDVATGHDSLMMPREQPAHARTPDAPCRRARRPSAPVAREAGRTGLIGERDREAFLDILSHELRTPVTTIYGGAQLLATRELPPARSRALAEDVRQEADRLYRVVEDLVILARSERDGIRPVGEPVAVGHVVIDAIEREIARHPTVQIRLLGGVDAAAEGADEIMVTHVVRNLLDNAIRYGGEGKPVEVIVEGTADEVAVRVIDRGTPPDSEHEAFALSGERPSTAAGRAGAGIGLYVADRLIKAMRGRMWAKPANDTGAEYGFALARSASSRSEQRA